MPDSPAPSAAPGRSPIEAVAAWLAPYFAARGGERLAPAELLLTMAAEGGPFHPGG